MRRPLLPGMRLALALAAAFVGGALCGSSQAAGPALATAQVGAPVLTLVGAPVVQGSGIALFIACHAAAGMNCQGEATLTTATAASATSDTIGERASGGTTLGTRTIELAAEREEELFVPYRPIVHRLLARDHKLRAMLTLRLTSGTPSPQTSAERTLTIHALDMPRVVHSIKESFLKKRGIRAKVTCPKVVVQAEDNNFICHASGVAGSPQHKRPFKVDVAVTQVNNSGYVTYISF